MSAHLAGVLETGVLQLREAAQLTGRLQFVASQLFGRVGNIALWHLRRFSSRCAKASLVDGALRVALIHWRDNLLHGHAREVKLIKAEKPIVLLTDGCCEGEGSEVEAGLGAVLVDPVNDLAECFGCWLSKPYVDLMRRMIGGDQIVCQAELIPAWASRVLWAPVLKGRRVLHFVDNDAARHGLVRGYSPSVASAAILGEVWAMGLENGSLSYFDRVASKSNLADGPSRLVFDDDVTVAGRRCRRHCAPQLDPLMRKVSEWA